MFLLIECATFVAMILTLLTRATVQVNLIHEVGSIEVIDYREKGTYVLGQVPRSLAMKLEQYSLDGAANDEENTSDKIDWAALGKGRHAKKA
jgi:hypothetical protein